MILPTKSGPLELSESLIAALCVKWPTKQVDRELSLMLLYLERRKAMRPVNGWRFIDNWLKKSPDVVAPLPRVAAWWATEQRTLNQGAGLGMTPRPGESIHEYRERIRMKMGQA
jgi:hypothetical protein